MRARRVLLAVADSPVLSELEGQLATTTEVAVVGCVTSGRDALEQVVLLRPDVLIVAPELPEVPGIEVARRLAEGEDSPRVILLATVDDSATRLAAEEAGADGWFVLSDSGVRLLRLIESLLP